MARARNIKPGFFQNDGLGELDPLSRLAFIGMWTIANFKGCIEYRPKMLKVQLLPYDNCDIEKIVLNLEQAGFIRFYSVQGCRYIKIVNFEKHQNPHKNEREAGTDIPDISENNIEITQLEKDGTKPDIIGTTRADSLNPITDSLNLIPSKKDLSTPSASTAKKGTRLPEDWQLSKAWGEWAASEKPNWSTDDIRRVAADFKDHFISVAGQKGLKLDWLATWRKWVRSPLNEIKPPSKNYSGGVQEARLDIAKQIFGDRNGNDRQIIDITPASAIEGNGNGIQENVPFLRGSGIR